MLKSTDYEFCVTYKVADHILERVRYAKFKYLEHAIMFGNVFPVPAQNAVDYTIMRGNDVVCQREVKYEDK